MRRLWSCIITLLLVSFSYSSYGQDWPTKPVRVVVPYSAGSASDIIPRAVFAEIEKELGQSFIIENRAGGSTIIGTAAVARASPDGYTLLATSSGFTTVPLTAADLPYDPLRDFSPIIPFGKTANVLIVSPMKGITTIKAFVVYARAKAGAVNYVTIGPGSAAHLNSERFRLSAKFEAQPIPFKGSAEGVTEIMAGRVDFYFCPLLPALQMIREGKVLALSVSSKTRSLDLPDVPTTLEAGFPDSEYSFWFGVFAPAETPPAIIRRLSDAIADALHKPNVREKLSRLGIQPMSMTPSEFSTYVREELARNATLAKAAKIKYE